MMKMELQGFEGLHKRLKELPERVEKKVLQASVTGAIREARKDIAAAAPRGDDPHSKASQLYGPLHKNIKVSRLRRVRKGEKGARVHTGDSFWGVFYELGTRNQPARPWFAPAFRGATDKMLGNLAKRLRIGIEKEFNRQ